MRKKDHLKIDVDPEEQPQEYEAKLYEILDGKIREYLEILKRQDPQFDMNGFRSVWIVKPNCKIIP